MDSTSEQLRFASIPGCTIRADFAGGGLSSDLGPLLLKGVDRQIGLTARVCAAIDDTRHPGYITHTLHDILKQRIYQIASGYEDGNDCNSLRHDPMFRLGVGCKPFDTDEADGALASGSTISRFEHAVDSKDIYRLSEALVDQFIAGYATPPEALVLDIDHSEDAAYGQQPLAFYNHYYQSTCHLPLLVFEGLSGALVAAVLRPGKRPTGAENAMIEIIDDRTTKSTIITSQIPVKAWHDVIGEPTLADAILDRIVHRAHVIQLTGETMRKLKKLDPTRTHEVKTNHQHRTPFKCSRSSRIGVHVHQNSQINA